MATGGYGLKRNVRWLSWCLVALLLATSDGVGQPPAAAPVVDQADPNQAFIQQLEEQFGPQIRQLQKAELHFLRTICQPTKEQYGKIAADSEPAIKAAIKALAENMGGRRRARGGREVNQPVDPRKSVAEALTGAVRTHLTPAQADRYQKELELRAAALKRVALLSLVAELDARLLLTAEQRGQMTKVLEKNWNESWNNLQLVQYVAHYLPQLPEAEVLPLLSDKQKSVWRGIPKNNVQFGFNFGIMHGMDVVEEVWVEDAVEKPVEKK
jgi:hypothetical protein